MAKFRTVRAAQCDATRIVTGHSATCDTDDCTNDCRDIRQKCQADDGHDGQHDWYDYCRLTISHRRELPLDVKENEYEEN